MSVALPQLLAALGTAQATMVAPQLEGSYVGGSAGTIAVSLLLLAQDCATAEARTTSEVAAMSALLGQTGSHAELLAKLAERHAEVDADPTQREAGRAILDLLVTMTSAAVLRMPGA